MSLPFLSLGDLLRAVGDQMCFFLKRCAESDEDFQEEINLRKAVRSVSRCRKRELELYLSPTISERNHVVAALVLASVT